MGDGQIPEDLRRFILVSCPSVPHLEALLLLRREPQEVWNAATLAQRLYIDPRRASEVLKDLVATTLLEFDDASTSYRYAASGTDNDLVARLAELYSYALVYVTQLIHGRSAQLFADAFKFRKD